MRYVLSLFLLLCLKSDAQIIIRGATLRGATLGVAASSVPPPGDTPFIVSGHGTSRNNFDGVVGCKFTATANITVTSLGRLVLSGNTQTHVVYLMTSSGIEITEATIPTTGIIADTYNYIAITPVALVSGTSYYLVSTEVNGGDSWYETAAVAVSTGTVNNSAHSSSPPPTTMTDDTAGQCFVNPNFLWH